MADRDVYAAGERALLESFLDQYRDAVVDKVEGLTDEQARQRLVPSGTTPAGLVKHLRWVEAGWFHLLLGERAGDHRRPHPRESEFTAGPDDAIADLLRDYADACARSREIAAGHDLGDVASHQRLGDVSVRWIYVHMIEETARHAGHLDILREQIDGRTG